MSRDAGLARALTIGPLRREDVPEALRLSDQAGWNQLRDDWHRLLELSPDGGLAARHDGRLVATATFVPYGRAVHWIGMVLVDEAYRGRGVGGAIFGHLMRACSETAPACIGLDATDLGVPLYRRQGFVPVRPIDRWSGSLRASAGADATRPLDARTIASVVALDRRVVGLDRGRLLRHLSGDGAVRGWVVMGGEGAEGYAFLRPGRTHWQLGPVVALRDEGFRALLAAASSALAGAPLYVDATRDPATSALLVSAGMTVARRLTRMTYGVASDALSGAGVRAAAGFEWG